MATRSKLGRNPLFKKRSSPVAGIIETGQPGAGGEASEAPLESKAEATSVEEARDLVHRLRQMEIEMDFGHLVRRLYGRLRRRPV